MSHGRARIVLRLGRINQPGVGPRWPGGVAQAGASPRSDAPRDAALKPSEPIGFVTKALLIEVAEPGLNRIDRVLGGRNRWVIVVTTGEESRKSVA